MKNHKNDIEKYLRGELSPAEMHALEKEALNDPFLAEALEGVEQTGTDNFLYDLHRINRSVHDRTHGRKKNKTIRMWGWTTGIAATVLLIAISGFLVVSLLKEQRAHQQAMNEKSPELQQAKPKADTIFIPLEKNISSPAETKKKRAPEKDDKARPGTLKATEPLSAGIETKDAAVEKQELSALDESPKNPEAENKAIDPQAGQAESIPLAGIRKPESAAVQEEEDTKKLRDRSTGLEAKTRVPAVSSVTPRAFEVKGKVISAEDGDALPGVKVTVKGTSISTVTDAAGNYKLDLPDAHTQLLFSIIGFEPRLAEVTGKPELNVQLQEDITRLSEVVVTGNGKEDKEGSSYRLAEPKGGKANFKNYLSRSMKYPDEAIKNKTTGKVTVRFTVEPNGQLTDFEVVKGIGFGCDEELLRLIKEGPSWTPSFQGDHAVRDKVKVRLRFELPQ